MLARVIDNLLSNALHYAPGPIELTGERVPPQAPGRSAGVRIGVLDRGAGIPHDQLATAFRPFHRVGARPEAPNGAFGLGLAIVRQLAHANGWQVSLEGRVGGGLAAWVVVNGAGTS